jgi:hypothetical protein
MQGKSYLAAALKQHPEMGKTIDLFFNVAHATPEEREGAFEALKQHMEHMAKPQG